MEGRLVTALVATVTVTGIGVLLYGLRCCQIEKRGHV